VCETSQGFAGAEVGGVGGANGGGAGVGQCVIRVGHGLERGDGEIRLAAFAVGGVTLGQFHLEEIEKSQIKINSKNNAKLKIVMDK
jgi:hypothetical protein